MEPQKKKITDKIKARAAAITQARQHNALMGEQIRAMENEMYLPKLRKKYIKFVVKTEYRNYAVLNVPKLLRWAKWIEYFFMARSKRKEIAMDMLRQEEKSR
jgi:hypothetical protein